MAGMRRPDPNMGARCIAVRRHPMEIVEAIVPLGLVDKWIRERQLSGWTAVRLEDRKLPI